MRRLTLAFLLVAACGRQTLEVQPDPDLYDEMVEAIEAANADVQPPLFRVVAKGGVVVRFVPKIEGSCGNYDYGTNIIQVSNCDLEESSHDKLKKLVRQAILLHELGHVLGLGHADDKMSIMYRSVARWWRLDEAVDSLHQALEVGHYSKTVILPPNAP